MSGLSPALRHYLTTNAPTLVNSIVDYRSLLKGSFPPIDMYDNRQHVGTVASRPFTQDILCRAATLRKLGVDRGDRIVLLATNTEHYLATVLAVLALGAIPCAVAPPPHPEQHDSAGVLHLRSAIEVVGPKLVVTQPRCAQAVHRASIVIFDELVGAQHLSRSELPTPSPSDVHHIQLTSGSTSSPKAVVLSHQNVVHNMAAICSATGAQRGVDRAFSWLPLYHDMGFIQVLCALTHGIPLAMMSPLSFLRDPLSWMRHMTSHRATQTAGPPFAYRAAADALQRKGADTEIGEIDLTGLRCAYVGAEPISYSTLDYFTTRFEPLGLSPNTLVPCYGMAESVLATTLALTPSRPGPENFGRVRVTQNHETGLSHVSCGPALDGIDIRITDADGAERPDGCIGDIGIHGPSIMLGYLTIDSAPPENGLRWHNTGDRGFLEGGELFVIGRSKELVIVRGRNFPPYDIERVIDDLDAVGPGRSLVFSIPDAGCGSEGVAAVVGLDTHAGNLAKVRSDIGSAVRAAFGFSLARIVLVRTESIPRTTSGKLQRVKARELFLGGNFPEIDATT